MKHNTWIVFSGLLLTSALLLIRCEKKDPDPAIPPESKGLIVPASGLTTTIFSFDGKLSDAGNQDDQLYYRWDWDADGQWDTKYSSEAVFPHRYYVPGMKQIVLEVLNSSGLSDTCHLNLLVQQGYSAPRAKYLINQTTGNKLTSFAFDASASKDDEDSLAQLFFRWDWEGNGSWDTGFSHDYRVNHTYYVEGAYQPIVEVKDPKGLTSQYQTNIEVNNINKNINVSFTWTPQSPLQLDTLTFDGSATTDPVHPDNKWVYYWHIQAADVSFARQTKSDEWFGPFDSPTFSIRLSQEGKYQVTLKVVDVNGLENTLIRSLTIYHLNRPPVATLSVSTKLGNLTTSFLLDASNTHDDIDLYSTLTFRWDFEGDNGWDTEYQSTRVLYHRFDTPGTHKIVVEAKDSQGLTDTTSIYVQVSSGTNETGLVIDKRFDHVEYYPTVKIGEQWWMARNMFYDPGRYTTKIDTMSTVCYDLDPNNCIKFGGLYTIYWASMLDLDEGAQGICPDGWHIPTRGEWETLFTTVGDRAAEDLSIGGTSDFNALYTGYTAVEKRIGKDGQIETYWRFSGLGSITYYWSSTPLRGSGAVSHWAPALVKGNPIVSTGYSGNSNFYSVRCIKNQE